MAMVISSINSFGKDSVLINPLEVSPDVQRISRTWIVLEGMFSGMIIYCFYSSFISMLSYDVFG